MEANQRTRYRKFLQQFIDHQCHRTQFSNVQLKTEPANFALNDEVVEAEGIQVGHVPSNVADQNLDLLEVWLLGQEEPSPDGVGQLLVVAENPEVVDQERSLVRTQIGTQLSGSGANHQHWRS